MTNAVAVGVGIVDECVAATRGLALNERTLIETVFGRPGRNLRSDNASDGGKEIN